MAGISGFDNRGPGDIKRSAEKSLEDITKIHNDLLEILKEFDTPEKRDYFPPAAVSAITRAAEAVSGSVYAAQQVISLHNHVLGFLLNPIEGSLKAHSETLQKEIDNLSVFTKQKTDETMRSVNEIAAKISDETINSMTAIEELSTKTINAQKESIDTIKELTDKTSMSTSEAQVQLREMMKQAKMQGRESLAEIKRLAREAKKDVGRTGWATAAIAVLCLAGGWYASSTYMGVSGQASNRHRPLIQEMDKKPEAVNYTKKDNQKDKIRTEKLKGHKITKTSGK